MYIFYNGWLLSWHEAQRYALTILASFSVVGHLHNAWIGQTTHVSRISWGCKEATCAAKTSLRNRFHICVFRQKYVVFNSQSLICLTSYVSNMKSSNYVKLVGNSSLLMKLCEVTSCFNSVGAWLAHLRWWLMRFVMPQRTGRNVLVWLLQDVKNKSSVGTEEEALSVILGRLGLADYEETFQKEQIDTEALVHRNVFASVELIKIVPFSHLSHLFD